MDVMIHFDMTANPMTSRIRLHPDTKEVQLLRLIADTGGVVTVEYGKEADHPEDLVLIFKPEVKEKK